MCHVPPCVEAVSSAAQLAHAVKREQTTTKAGEGKKWYRRPNERRSTYAQRTFRVVFRAIRLNSFTPSSFDVTEV